MLYQELVARIDKAVTEKKLDKLFAILRDPNRKYPDVEKFKKEYEPDGHDVMDDTIRKDKITREPDKVADVPVDPAKGMAGGMKKAPAATGKTEIVATNRVALPFQYNIVETRVNFAFGRPVSLECNPEEEQKKFLEYLKKVLKKNKIETVDRVYAREALRATRVAEHWFFVPDKPNSIYGEATPGKWRVVVWKPWDGNKLHPFYDDYGDMIAFSREFTMKDENDNDVRYFETYTQNFKYQWRENNMGGQGWDYVEKPVPNPYGKIPVLYTDFERTAWQIVQSCIRRAEFLVSDHGDTNAYFAAPKFFLSGKINSFMKKGETGGVINGEVGAKAEILSWDNAPESIKLELEVLYRSIYNFTNTPDLSFEQMSKMTNPSGETMKMLFMAAYLQVLSDSEKWNDWQDRRINLLKSMISFVKKDFAAVAEAIEIEPKIQPFSIEDLKAKIEMLMTANGGKAMLSRETTMNMLGTIENVQEEIERIEAEDDAEGEKTLQRELKLQTAGNGDEVE